MRKLLPFLALFPFAALAHEGHNEKKPEPARATANYFSAEALTDKYEVLVKHGEIAPGEEASLELFLSEAATNLPVDSAELAISSSDDAALTFLVEQVDRGHYLVTATFPKAAAFGLTISIDAGPGADLVLLQSVQVGKPLAAAEAEEHTEGTGLSTPLAIAIGLVGGSLIALLLRRRGGRKGVARAAVLLVLAIGWPLRIAFAHEGHGDTKKPAAPLSNELNVLKETQFLFGLATQVVRAAPMERGLRLFGTVIPSSSGRASISSLAAGRIGTVHVRVGEQVRKGQVLASIVAGTDAASGLDLQAQRNAVEAEYLAAKTDLERLRAISDIASKKDITEAEARFAQAEQNKQLFAGQGRSYALTSPIDGVVGSFVLSPGSPVQAAEALFTVTDLRTVYVEAQVFDRDAAFVTGQASYTAECTTDEHRVTNVRLISSAQEIDPTNQSQRVLFEMDNAGGEFKIGEFVTVVASAPTGATGITVPSSAIVELDGRAAVFIKDAAERYSLSYVSVGEEGGRSIPVLRGAEEGERVVVSAAYQLKMMYLNQ